MDSHHSLKEFLLRLEHPGLLLNISRGKSLGPFVPRHLSFLELNAALDLGAGGRRVTQSPNREGMVLQLVQIAHPDYSMDFVKQIQQNLFVYVKRES